MHSILVLPASLPCHINDVPSRVLCTVARALGDTGLHESYMHGFVQMDLMKLYASTMWRGLNISLSSSPWHASRPCTRHIFSSCFFGVFPQVGDTVAPGDVFCEVETDKATIGWESQEEGFIAQILQPNGAKDIAVGVPALVLVEDKVCAALIGCVNALTGNDDAY